MNAKRHTVLAALLAAVTLAAPGTALAGGGEPAVTPLPAVEAKEATVVVPLTAAKITREEAIALAAKQFAIPADLGEPNANLSQNKGFASWEVTWRTPAKKPNPRSYTVMVNAVTGQITNYSYNSAAANDVPLSYSRSDAYKVAETWLSKLAADRKDALRYVDNPLQYGFWGGNASFQFHWDRMEQGYPVRDQGVDITIDARTGDLQYFTTSWQDDLKAEKPATILDQAQADAAYLKNLPMQMLYRYYQKPATDKGEWKLIYRPYGGGFPVVTQEGKLTQSWTGEPIDYARLSDVKLVPAGAKAYEKPAKPLTPEEGLLFAQQVTGRKDAPNNMDCREEGDEQKRQSCYFSWYDEKEGGSVSLQLDMTTGLVAHYSNWGRYDSLSDKSQPKYTEAQARQIVIDFVQKYRPDMAGKALMSPAQSDMEKVRIAAGDPIRSYHVSLTMTHEYIPVSGLEAGAEVDAMTGEIRYFSGPMSELGKNEPYPELKDLIKGSDALEIYLKQQGLELTWVTYNPDIYRLKMDPGAESKAVTTLVWAPRRVMGIEALDAVTGVPYDYEGRNLIEAAKRPVDIDGHFAQREIELLWARGIFELKDGKFNPDQTVAAAELARWLVLARGMQPYPMYDFAGNFTSMPMAGANLAKSAEAAYFGAALQAGILLPEDFAADADPNAPVTRELYALWVVRALGYGDIAKMESRIEMTFADKAAIGAKYANAVALMNGLKIAGADASGNFNPQRMITRGEAAKMLFAVASKARSYWM
ncbi:MAG TPA: YcdB/YcdC domain-containing protein [Symbiobacteriaceae bacterium]|nr:YcdB/YcdC domain-containing protein [Symbiobacteriaceae bacterium]